MVGGWCFYSSAEVIHLAYYTDDFLLVYNVKKRRKKLLKTYHRHSGNRDMEIAKYLPGPQENQEQKRRILPIYPRFLF